MKKKSGVSLITLIITIIVMIILASTVITTIVNNNYVERANEATFKSSVSSYEEELSMYILNKILEDNKYESSDLNADKNSGSEIINGTVNNLSGIKSVITSMKNTDTEIFSIQNGKLMISEEATDKEKEWADSVGVTMPNFGKNNNTEARVAKVNKPVLAQGLTPITFNDNGDVISVKETDSSWYAYIDQGTYLQDGKTSRWANAMSKDGSQWVWIPRYAYKIVTSGTNIASEIQVVFIDINNKDEAGNDYTNGYNGYIVHPAFTNNVEAGGWNSELYGIWIAKYEAGFGGINGIDSNGTSSIKYSINSSNELGNITANTTKITYPVFKPNASSYDYISIGDSYALTRALTETNNPYGFSKGANSHMLKNSEWGAVAYLAQSKYGRNGIEIAINNKNLEDDSRKIYSITGYGCLNDKTDAYNTNEGKSASTTGNLYGIYDMSGGTTEWAAGYINNKSSNLLTYGKKMVDQNNDGKIDDITSEFISVYDSAENDRQEENYSLNSLRKGEAIWETSSSYTGSVSWFEDYLNFPHEEYPFFARGGAFGHTPKYSGIFSCNNTSGPLNYYGGFRAALCNAAM